MKILIDMYLYVPKTQIFRG